MVVASTNVLICYIYIYTKLPVPEKKKVQITKVEEKKVTIESRIR